MTDSTIALIERLKQLSSPDAEYLSDGARLTAFVHAGVEAATELTTLLERCEKAEADSACVVKALVNETNRAEVAEARVKEWERVADKLQDQIHKYDALLDTAIRERDELRKALEPFIRLADEVFSDGKNENVTDGIIHWYFNDINITFGDLRRARASSDNHD
jgi:hypothetical protein